MIDNIDNTSDETTPPLPKGFKVIKKQEVVPPLPKGFTPLKKKESTDSTSTTIPPKLDSGTPTGSSGGVNPFPKAKIYSPIPDYEAMPKSKETAIPQPKQRGFASEVFHKLATGSAQLGADMSAIPELLYDTAAIPQNAIADYFDLPNLRADSEKFKKTIGVRNAVKELYQGEVKKLREESAKVDEKYKYGIYDSFKNGDIKGGFSQLTNSFAESLPATTSIMLGGAYAKTPQLLATSTMMFGAGKNEQLKTDNPDMNANARVINALGTGFAEGAFETMGSGSIGAAAKGLLEREGKAKAATILKDGLVDFYKSALKKSPFTASLAGEGIEEWATQVTQNSIDVATGVKPQDFNIFDGATDAFIGGAFGGAVFGGGLKGLEQMANNQDKATIKSNVNKTFELQKALENPEITEESKAQIHKTIDGLVKTNQDLVQKNIDHADNLHPKVKEKLVESVTKIDETKNAVKAIKLDDNTNDAQKQILLDGLKEDFKKHNALKADILDGKTTPVDVLPLKEQDKIKRQALKELTAEQNPDGKKSIEIDNAQIVERANKIYKANEELKTPTPEVQSQAEKVDEDLRLSLNDSKEVADEKIRKSKELEAKPQEVSPLEDVVAPSVEKPLSLGENNTNNAISKMDSESVDKIIDSQKDKQGDEIVFKPNTLVIDAVKKAKIGDEIFIDIPNDKYLYGFDSEPYPSINHEKGFIPTEKREIKEPININIDSLESPFVEASDGNHRIVQARFNNDGTIPAKLKITKEIKEQADNFDINKSISEAYNKAKENGSNPELVKAVEESLKNEKSQNGDIVTNGNIRPTTTNLGEVRATEQESPIQESVPSSVDGGEVKGDVEVDLNLDDVSNFLNEQFGAKKPVEVKETPKPKNETTSDKYVEKPLNEIKTDETRFQNRTELDEEQLKSIKDNWNENELDPVVIWKDEKGESFILAGHHRLEAAKQLGKKAIDARYFKGTEAEAIKYATEKSNANRTMEQSYDRAKKLRQLRESGASKKEIDEFSNGDGKNKKFVVNLSHLNPKGKIMDMLKSFGKAGDKETVRLTESAADWIGESRKHYPEFTDAHENELYDYLINKGNLKKIGNKTEFTTRLQKYADAVRLFPDEPLNIEHRGVKGDLEQSKTKEIDVVKADIKVLEKERDKGTPTEARLTEITKLIEIKNAELGKLNKQLSEAKAGDKVQGDLFDMALNDVVEKINDKQITDEQANEFINGENKPDEAIIADIKGKAKNAERISKEKLEKGIADADNALQVGDDNFDFGKLFDGSLDNNENALTESEIQADKDKKNEELYQNSSFDKKWAKTYKEAVNKLQTQIKDAEAVIEKWSAKVYKKGAGNAFVGGELEGKNVNLDRVNENRRDKAIKNAKQDIIQAKKDLKELGIADADADAIIGNDVKATFPKELTVFGINENTTVEQLKKIFEEAGEKVKEQYSKINKVLQASKNATKERVGYDKIHNDHLKFGDFVKKYDVRWYEKYGEKTVGEFIAEKNIESAEIAQRIAEKEARKIPNIDGDFTKEGKYLVTEGKGNQYYFDTEKIDPNRKYTLSGKTLIENVPANRQNIIGEEYNGNGSVQEAIALMDKVQAIDVPEKNSTSQVLDALIDSGLTATDLRGLDIKNPPTTQGLERFIEHYKEKLGKYSNVVSDKVLEKLYNEDVIRNLKKYDTPERIGIFVKDTRVESVVDGFSKKPTTKEKVNAEVDRIAQQVKDWLPGIKDPDLKKQGISQDQLIDLIASAVKNLVSAGIDVNDAIKQVVESIKAKFGDIDIDVKAVEERISPKKEADNDFKSKSGKKSLLNRAFEGGNSQAITDAIESHGLDYRIENQEEAKQRAEDFVDEVGSAVALEAVRNNQIKGAEKAFVYSTIIDNLLNELDRETDPIAKEKLEAEHAKIIADITNELSQEGTDAGRFISALNKVYNSSKLRYNLKTQIESHKASNNGVISDEVLEKFTQADKRIKELEKLIEEAEAKVKKAEEEASIKNIQEDIERKKQLANKNKSGLTPREQTRKKELSNKFFGRFNDATSMVTALADPEFREYLGLTFKQAKGDINNFTKRVLAELGKGVQKHITELFEEGKKSTSTNSKSITIGKSGKLSIPAQLFRDYVEAGETDIDVIAALIKKDIAEDFPDADVRDIRDALTGYGKQINPTKDDVSIEISRLKRLGKLISAYEDASNGINPLKSGLKQPKPTQEMRDLKKEINRLIKENGLDAVDLEKQWASALDKIKSQLKNQIEDLDKQIANGEKRKVERTTTVLDEEATALKALRDAKKKLLDDMVGKPELTEEQLIARAEKSLQTSIDNLQKEIADGQIEYKQKPTTKQSQKLDELRKQRKDLVETKNRMREEAGLVEAQRLSVAKKRVKNQIEGLQQKIADKDYSKKEPKPLIEDTELTQLRAEKLIQQEVYDAQKYADELKNRSKLQKWSDALIELWNVPRILKATGELSTVLVQGGVLTTSRKLTNPKALGIIMKQLLISLGSAKSAAKYEALIKAHPKYPLAIKVKLALTNPDYKSDVREEQYSGDYANLFWDLPFVLASYNSRASKVINKERAIFGDVLKKVTGIGTPGTDKLSMRQQWKNVNPFVALERGGTLYMNTLRMEEFVRGTEMLRMEGKNEVDHLQDYKLVGNAINSMSGRANLPAAVATSSKFLAAVFFSARNAVSIVNQVNPIYYGYLHFGSTDGVQIKKTSVANKLALTNMMRFVTITGLTMLAIKASAGKDDEDEDIVQIETDPNSSDFMKMKIGNVRFDALHGMTTMIVLMSRLITENIKSTSDGKTTKLGEKSFGPQSRLDLLGTWARNKFAPSMAITANYLDTKAEVDPETGDEFRQTPFGKKFIDDESLNLAPMYWSSVKEIQKEDPGVVAEFLTVVSVFGWNSSVYKVAEPKDKFKDSQEKIKEFNDKPKEVQDRIRANDRVVVLRQKVSELENFKRAKLTNTPYLVKGAEQPADLSNFDVQAADVAIAKLKERIEEFKTKAGDKYKAPKE